MLHGSGLGGFSISLTNSENRNFKNFENLILSKKTSKIVRFISLFLEKILSSAYKIERNKKIGRLKAVCFLSQKIFDSLSRVRGALVPRARPRPWVPRFFQKLAPGARPRPDFSMKWLPGAHFYRSLS